MNFFLVGYMGSGKSVIGKRLSGILDFDYIDLDDYIELKENASIASIFKSKGEIYFRKIEGKYLQDLMALDNTVVSLGGGTPCYGNNMAQISEENNNNIKSIYLKASIPTLTNRLFNERLKRPLISHLNSKNELTDFIGKHLFERSVYYEQAHFTIKTDDKSIDDVVEDILLKLF